MVYRIVKSRLGKSPIPNDKSFAIQPPFDKGCKQRKRRKMHYRYGKGEGANPLERRLQKEGTK